MSRIKSNNIELFYTNAETISREDISNVLRETSDEFIICNPELGKYHCLTYSKKRHDIQTFRKFSVKGIIPTGNSVMSYDMENIKTRMMELDIEYVSEGIHMPLTSRIARSTEDQMSPLEKELISLRKENEELKSKYNKLKRKTTSNITYNTIINYGDIFNVNVNNIGQEDLNSISLEDKIMIMEQKRDKEMALKCIETVHLNRNNKYNNNLFITNLNDDKIIVRRDGKWSIESNYKESLSEMTRNVPKQLKFIIDDPHVPRSDVSLRRATRLIQEEIESSDLEFIHTKLPSMIYSYTKSITNMVDDDC